MTFQDAFDKFLLFHEAKGNSDRTIRTYEQRLRWFKEFTKADKLNAINADEVDMWVVTMRREELSTSTVNSRLRDIKTFFRWCVDRGYLSHSPADHLPVKQNTDDEIKAMSPEDLQRIYDQATNERDAAIICFIASTGCRAGEAAQLRIKNLDMNEREAKICGKTGTRFVDFNNKTANVLTDWLSVHPRSDSGFVFVGLRFPHNPMTSDSIYQMFRRLAIRGGVTGFFNPHSVRHLVGQQWTDTSNIEMTRKKLGHKDIKSTLRYANQDRSRLKSHTDQINLL